MNKLIRGLSLRQAVAINTIDMVGIGPFITIPFIIGAMNGPQCILAWVLGAVLSFLYIWQTIIQAPLVVASGAIGFSQYLTFLIPLTTI